MNIFALARLLKSHGWNMGLANHTPCREERDDFDLPDGIYYRYGFRLETSDTRPEELINLLTLAGHRAWVDNQATGIIQVQVSPDHDIP